MITVIEHGYKKYRIRCDKCNCLYEYELEDVTQDSVDCPDCGQSNCHNFTLNVDLTSRIEDVEIKE